MGLGIVFYGMESNEQKYKSRETKKGSEKACVCVWGGSRSSVRQNRENAKAPGMENKWPYEVSDGSVRQVEDEILVKTT